MTVVAIPRVAFQGEIGAFSEEAVHAFFGADNVTVVPCIDFPAVADSVLRGTVQCGVLPIENSIAGSVVAAYDILAGQQLTVHGELVRPIRLCLLGLPGTTTSMLRRVMSHPVALAQCTRFLGTLAVERIAVHDTAGAARLVAQQADPEMAAVAGHAAALQYGLATLAEDVQDRPDNQTRFLVIARPDTPPPALRQVGRTRKTVLLLETEHRAGALVEVLRHFADGGISLTHIESRPGDRPWHYRFVIEVLADTRAAATRNVIDQAASAARSLIVLGSFPMFAGTK